jgi:hypothetical protein
MNIVTLYAVHQGDSDMHCGKPKWYFLERSEAEHVARKRGWYGGDAPISKKRAIKDGERYLVLENEQYVTTGGPEDELAIRKVALAKLTPFERTVLGLSE